MSTTGKFNWSRLGVIAVALIAIAGETVCHGDDRAACVPMWEKTFGRQGGVSSSINSLEVLPNLDGSGSSLYLAGGFKSAGGLSATGIASWDGTAYTTYPGIDGYVADTAVYDDGNGMALYAAGYFRANGDINIRYQVAKWDGASWSIIGTVTGQPGPSAITAIEVYDDGGGAKLYVGGEFHTAGGVAVKNMARWNGKTWEPVGGGVDDMVLRLRVLDFGDGPELVAVGAFSTVNGNISASRIARWNGAWQAHSSAEFFGSVADVALYDDGSGPALYACGSFILIDHLPRSRIAKWNGNSWQAMGSGLTGNSFSVGGSELHVHDDGSGPALFVAGAFDAAGGIATSGIAKWDGSWSGLHGGLRLNDSTNSIGGRALATYNAGDGKGPVLYVGGDFDQAGDVYTESIASWDGTTWHRLMDDGIVGTVYAIAEHNDGTGNAIYVAGDMSSAGGIPVHNIARWNGSAWEAVGSGLPMLQGVTVLVSFDDGSGPALFAGGWVGTTDDSTEQSRMWKWDGKTWSQVGELDFDADVKSAAVFDDGTGGGPALFVGTFYCISDGCSWILKWDGITWQPLSIHYASCDGICVEGVRAMRAYDDGSGPALYATGFFRTADDEYYRVAKLEGDTWVPIPGSNLLPGGYNALAFYDDGSGNGTELYIGGSSNSSSPLARIAKFNGTEWVPVGGGVGNYTSSVNALEVFDDGSGKSLLYIGGNFRSPTGHPQPQDLLTWDGNSYAAVDHVSLPVNVMCTTQINGRRALLVGGDFTSSPAGDAHLALLQGCAPVCAGDFVSSKTFAAPADGVVDAADLAFLLGSWGSGPGSLADIVSGATFQWPPDGIVDAADLAVLLGGWGSCH